MNGRITRALLAVAVGVTSASCVTVSAAERPDGALGQTAESAVSSAALGECARPDVVFGATVRSSPVDLAAAQRAAARIGVRGDASLALLSTVTIGTRTGSVATTADALVDGRGTPIIDRPAWILVFRNQSVRMPSNGPFLPGAVRGAPPPSMSVLAAVVDAQTGDFLRGWGCAFAT